MSVRDKAGVEHWDDTWARLPSMRLPRASTSSLGRKMRWLHGVVPPGMRLLEIGCAPGTLPTWTAAMLGAGVSGQDYSGPGGRMARRLFREFGLIADIRNQEVFATILKIRKKS